MSYNILKKTAADLMNKNLFPDYALSYLKDESMLKSALIEWRNSPTKSFRCPDCGITINAPKTWIIQHVKIHHNKKQKDNEIRETRINPYWELNKIRI